MSGGTSKDGQQECYASLSDLIQALELSQAAAEAVYHFLEGSPAFAWPKHMTIDDVDEGAVERCATVWSTDGSNGYRASDASYFKIWLKSLRPPCIFTGPAIGTSPVDPADCGAHWVQDERNRLNEAGSPDNLWFCSTCHSAEIARLGNLMRGDAAELALPLLSHIGIRTRCEAILHEGTYAHKQKHMQAAAYSAQEITEYVVRESLGAVESITPLVTALVNNMAKMAEEVHAIQQSLSKQGRL
jgi:hypothetical protein